MIPRRPQCYALGQVTPRLLRLTIASALLAATLAFSAPVHADDFELPPGYVSVQQGQVQWVFPESLESRIVPLRQTYRQAWNRVVDDLGVPLEPGLVIRIARNPQEMQRLAPRGLSPPQYAAGVAYPSRGLILLTLSAPNSWEPPELEAVLTHELSHIALFRAVRGHPVPRWFSEGLAIYQSAEFRIARMRTLLEGAVLHEIVPLNQLSERFPDRPYKVNIAYAQSADVVGYLRRDDLDEEHFRELVAELGQGVPFDEALSASYGWTPTGLERAWRQSLRKRYRWAPIFFGGTTIWSLMALLVVVAWHRRRKDSAGRLRKMEAEERFAEWQQTLVDEQASPGSNEAGSLSEREVPKVEHDGESHTLH